MNTVAIIANTHRKNDPNGRNGLTQSSNVGTEGWKKGTVGAGERCCSASQRHASRAFGVKAEGSTACDFQ
eukprot:3218890-Rhodomonas_salina.1